MNVLGVDLSLTATGIADNDGTRVIKPKMTGIARLDHLATAVIQSCYGDADDVVFLEGYAFGRPNQAHYLGELGGVVRHTLWKHRIHYTDVPPAVVKKFATGKGNARKPDMLDASRRAGYEGSNDDNAVDAWWLRQFGLYVLGAPAVPSFAYRDDIAAAFTQEVA